MSDEGEAPDAAFVLYDLGDQGKALVLTTGNRGFRVGPASVEMYGQQTEIERWPVDERAADEIARRLRQGADREALDRLAAGLASALASAGFVKRSGHGPDWWRCTACGQKGRGPDEIEHGEDCPERIYEEWRAARAALTGQEGEREPCIDCDHPMNLHDEHVGCTVGWENLSQGCRCTQGADPAPEEEPEAYWKAMLERYGQHHPDCYYIGDGPEDGCNCGWQERVEEHDLDVRLSDPPMESPWMHLHQREDGRWVAEIKLPGGHGFAREETDFRAIKTALIEAFKDRATSDRPAPEDLEPEAEGYNGPDIPEGVLWSVAAAMDEAWHAGYQRAYDDHADRPAPEDPDRGEPAPDRGAPTQARAPADAVSLQPLVDLVFDAIHGDADPRSGEQAFNEILRRLRSRPSSGLSDEERKYARELFCDRPGGPRRCPDCSRPMVWDSPRQQSWMCPTCVYRRIREAERADRPSSGDGEAGDGDERVWLTEASMEPGDEEVRRREDGSGGYVYEGSGVYEPGRIVLTLETSTADPGKVPVAEILDAVKRWCMTAPPEGEEGGRG